MIYEYMYQYTGPRLEYILTGDGLTERRVRLNGRAEWLSDAKQLVPRPTRGKILISIPPNTQNNVWKICLELPSLCWFLCSVFEEDPKLTTVAG